MEERRDRGEEGIGGGGEVMIPSLIRVFIAPALFPYGSSQ